MLLLESSDMGEAAPLLMQGMLQGDRARNSRPDDLRIDYSPLLESENAKQSALEKKRGLPLGSLGRPYAEGEVK